MKHTPALKGMCAFFLLVQLVAVFPAAGSQTDRLDRIWKNRKQDLINWIHSGFTSSPVNPYILYNVQLYTANILRDAARRGNVSQLDELSEVYLTAYDYLETNTNYVYYYWPGEASESIHNLETPARMWLDDPSKTDNGVLGIESKLISGQFLYGVAYLIHAVCNIPAAQRTAAMIRLAERYTPVILTDHYHRWLFSGQGEFQRRGWGPSVGLFNHQEHLGRLLNREYTGTVSYMNVVTDTDLWIIAGVTEMLSAHAKEPLLVPMTGSAKTNLLDYVALGVELIASRLSVSTLTNFQGQAADGIQFDLGEWDDHSTYQYAGYTGALSPLGQGWAPIPADNIGWDISHARRFVNVFETLYRNRVFTGMSFPSRTLMEGLAAQLIYGAFNKDLDAPRFSNFMDGQNGWFRVGYHEGFAGYPPYGMSRSFTTGGYGFWAEFNPDIAAVSGILSDQIEALYTKDLSGNDRGCIAAGSVWQSDTGNGSAGCMMFLGDGSSFVNGGVWTEYSSPVGTIEFWLKPEPSGGDRDLVKIFEDRYHNYLLVQRRADGTISVFIRNNNAWVLNRRTIAAVPSGVWTHFAVTQDGGGAKIYINGVEASATGMNSGAWTDSFVIRGARFAKGHDSASAFCGAMDDIRVYNRALTAPEVAQDMAGQVSHSGNMLLRWEFDDIPGYSDIGFIMGNYAADYDLSSSLDLLMFLPSLTPGDPFFETFEPEGDNAGIPGPLNGQNGWVADAGAVVQPGTVFVGTQALELSGAQASRFIHSSSGVVWCEFNAKFVRGDITVPDGGAYSAVFGINRKGHLVAYSNEVAVIFSRMVLDDDWHYFKLYCNAVEKRWSLWIDSILFVDQFEYYATPDGFSFGAFRNDSSREAYIDEVYFSDKEGTLISDRDGDLLPDFWEIQYSGSPTGADPGAICANGVNTFLEAYIAGLNPKSLIDIFGVSHEVSGSNRYALAWTAVEGRFYSVYWTDNLLNGFPAIPIASNITEGAFTHSSPAGSGFYRIEAYLTP